MRRSPFLILIIAWLSVLGFASHAQDRSQIRIPTINLNKPVDEAALSGLSRDQLCLLRNTIYARHGRRFQTAWLQNYFNHQPWYIPSSSNREPSISVVEERNAETIARVEHRLPSGSIVTPSTSTHSTTVLRRASHTGSSSTSGSLHVGGNSAGPNDESNAHDYARPVGSTNDPVLSTGWTHGHGSRTVHVRDYYRHTKTGKVVHVHGYYRRHR